MHERPRADERGFNFRTRVANGRPRHPRGNFSAANSLVSVSLTALFVSRGCVMLLTPNREKVLRAERRYFYLRAGQLRELLFPGAKDGSFMRGLLRGLE